MCLIRAVFATSFFGNFLPRNLTVVSAQPANSRRKSRLLSKKEIWRNGYFGKIIRRIRVLSRVGSSPEDGERTVDVNKKTNKNGRAKNALRSNPNLSPAGFPNRRLNLCSRNILTLKRIKLARCVYLIWKKLFKSGAREDLIRDFPYCSELQITPFSVKKCAIIEDE